MRLVDSLKSNILELNFCNNIQNISGEGFLSGHMKIEEANVSIVWGILLKFRDGERSINAYWNGLEGVRSLSGLVGKSLVLIRDENPQEEDFGYYCGSHKDLECLRVDFISSSGSEFNVNVKALGNFGDDGSEVVIFKGFFDLIFRDIRLEEYCCSS